MTVWKDSDEAAFVRADGQESRCAKHLLQNTGTDRMKISEYEEQLRKRHREMHSNTGWARIMTKEEKKKNEEKMEILQSADALLGESKPLRKGRIEVSAATDANVSDQDPTMLSSMEYSPNGEIFMSASRHGKFSFFHLDGAHNPLLDSLSIHKVKLIKAGFLPQSFQASVKSTKQLSSYGIVGDGHSKPTPPIHSCGRSGVKIKRKDLLTRFGRDFS